MLSLVGGAGRLTPDCPALRPDLHGVFNSCSLKTRPSEGLRGWMAQKRETQTASCICIACLTCWYEPRAPGRLLVKLLWLDIITWCADGVTAGAVEEESLS